MLAFLIAWLPATALMIVLLLNFGTNWRGVGHAIVPAAIIAAALTGMFVFIFWSFAYVFGNRAGLARAAVKILDEKYFAAFTDADELQLAPARVFAGGAVRYSGRLRRLALQIDFFTTAITFPRHQGDLSTVNPGLQIQLAVLRLELPDNPTAQRETIAKRAEAAGRALQIAFRVQGKVLLNSGMAVLMDGSGREQISPEQFRALLTGLASAING